MAVPCLILLVLLFTLTVTSVPINSTGVSKSLSFYLALQSKGILSIAFDPTKNKSDSLRIASTNENAGYMPGWLTSHGNKIYSISRTNFPDNTSTSGGLFAFAKDDSRSSATQALTLLNQVSSEGLGGVYCDISPDGRTLSATNIDGASVSIHSLSETGYIGPPTYRFAYNLTRPGPGADDSQIQSNPHEAMFDPSGRYMFVPDRGADRLYVYQVEGPHEVLQVKNITLPPGTGPRHLTFKRFNNARTYLYLISELDNTIRVFTLSYATHSQNTKNASILESGLTVELQQTVSTLGLGDYRTPPNNDYLAGEVAISRDGRFLYASNRDTQSLASDTLAVYSVDQDPAQDATHLTYLGQNLTYGKIPRNFALSKDKDNRYIAIGNEVTQSVVVLERDVSTGFAKSIKGELSFGDLDISQKLGPTCVLWT